MYLPTPLRVHKQRDPEGFYRKARRGEIPEVTGVSAPYGTPRLGLSFLIPVNLCRSVSQRSALQTGAESPFVSGA